MLICNVVFVFVAYFSQQASALSLFVVRCVSVDVLALIAASIAFCTSVVATE